MSTRTSRVASPSAAVALAIALAGCSTGAAAPPRLPNAPASPSASAPASASPSPSAADPEAKAVAEANAAVRRYYGVMDRLSQDPKVSADALKAVAISSGLVEAQQTIATRRQAGVRQVGAFSIISTTPTHVSLTYKPGTRPAPEIPTVDLDVCYDVSQVSAVDKDGKSAVAGNRMSRGLEHLGVANYSWPAPNGWRIAYSTTKGEPCT